MTTSAMVNSAITRRGPSGSGKIQSCCDRLVVVVLQRAVREADPAPAAAVVRDLSGGARPGVGCQLLRPYATCASSAVVHSPIAAVTSRSPSPP